MADIAVQAFKFDGESPEVLRAAYAKILVPSLGYSVPIVLPSKEDVRSGTVYGYVSNTTGTLVSSGGSSENWS